MIENLSMKVNILMHFRVYKVEKFSFFLTYFVCCHKKQTTRKGFEFWYIFNDRRELVYKFCFQKIIDFFNYIT